MIPKYIDSLPSNFDRFVREAEVKFLLVTDAGQLLTACVMNDIEILRTSGGDIHRRVTGSFVELEDGTPVLPQPDSTFLIHWKSGHRDIARMSGPDPRRAADLKLVDELLTLFKPSNLTWEEFEGQYSITRDAIERLRSSWKLGTLPTLTASLANYFEASEHE